MSPSRVSSFRHGPALHSVKCYRYLCVVDSDLACAGRLRTGQGAKDVAFNGRWNRTEVVVIVHSEQKREAEKQDKLQVLLASAFDKLLPVALANSPVQSHCSVCDSGVPILTFLRSWPCSSETIVTQTSFCSSARASTYRLRCSFSSRWDARCGRQ